jgi:uncharacterized damage-inducible protein DinB
MRDATTAEGAVMSEPLNHLRRLVEHLDWADSRVLAALRSARNASPAAFRLYSHLLGAEHTWLARISGRSPGVAVWPDLSLDECELVARENAAELHRVVDGMAESDRARPIVYRNTAGKEFTTGLEDILLHVALHGAYHRGQVAALLREGGDEPQATDYIVFTREGN